MTIQQGMQFDRHVDTAKRGHQSHQTQKFAIQILIRSSLLLDY